MRVTSDMVGNCDHRIRDFVLFSRLPSLLRLTQRHFPFDRSTGAQSLLYKLVRLLCVWERCMVQIPFAGINGFIGRSKWERGEGKNTSGPRWNPSVE